MESILRWEPKHDREIAKALVRQRDLHERWHVAQREAVEAEEAVATTAREDHDRRAETMSRGKADPGPATERLEAAEAAAAAASESRDLLADAFGRARSRALQLAADREPQWSEAAQAAHKAARTELAGALDALDAAYAAERAAATELEFATNARARERGQARVPHSRLSRLVGRNGEAFDASTVLAALRELLTEPEPEPEVEPVVMSATERREFVARGGTVEIVPGG